MKLTPARICAQNPGVELSEISRAKFNGCGVTEIDDISSITGLLRLDLSENDLTGESLSGLQWSKKLRHLDISSNKVDTLKHLAGLDNLEILKAGQNEIKSLDHLRNHKNLKALILNNNRIKLMENAGALQNLNSLGGAHHHIR